jgi:hypothetical protein
MRREVRRVCFMLEELLSRRCFGQTMEQCCKCFNPLNSSNRVNHACSGIREAQICTSFTNVLNIHCLTLFIVTHMMKSE